MSADKMTILQFQRLTQAISRFEDNPYELGMEQINIFEGIDKEEIKKWKVKEFNDHLKKYDWLGTFEMPNDFVKEFEYNGRHYKVSQYISDWDMSQFVSMSTLTKEPDKIIQNTHLIMAVMCQDERSLEERADDFQNGLSVLLAYPIAVFFCLFLNKCVQDIPNFFQVVEKLIGFQTSGHGMI